MSARCYMTIQGSFAMHRGGALESPTIAYETWGELSDKADNAVLIFTGLSPSAHAAASDADRSPGWWEEMVGPGRPIDTHRYFVICINSFGSCFGSTGPATVDPATDVVYRLNFPVLSLEDVARSGALLLDHLAVDTLAACVGPSMGGMTALAFQVLFPGRSRSFVSISSAPRALPFSIALRSLQREMIRRDPNWQQGNYTANSLPITGMRLARKLGMITYRSANEWRQRFGRERIAAERDPEDPFGLDFEVESYLENHARKFTGDFDPNCYLYLSRAMDLFDVADHGASVEAGLAQVETSRILVIGVSSDILFPLHQQQELAAGLARPGRELRFESLDCIHGHDSFLVDMDRFRPIVADFFSG